MRFGFSLAAIALAVGVGAVSCTFTVEGVTGPDVDLSANDVDLSGTPDLTIPSDLTPPPVDLIGVDLTGFDLTPPPDLATPPDMTPPRDLATPPDMTAPPDMTPLPDMAVPPDMTPVTSLLTVSQKTMSLADNFSAEGTLDWVHYGFGGSATARNEKIGASEIGALQSTGTVQTFGAFQHDTSWTDGTPQMMVVANHDGVFTDGTFTITANATTTTRILRVYVVIFKTTGTVTVSMPGETPFTSMTSSSSNTGAYRVFKVTYRATSNQTLTFTIERMGGTGDISFLGATLTTAP
jgi:hypothetical protein